jgi:hypothetical protein
MKRNWFFIGCVLLILWTGIFFSLSHFDVSDRVHSVCLNNCNNFGDCVSGECICWTFAQEDTSCSVTFSTYWHNLLVGISTCVAVLFTEILAYSLYVFFNYKNWKNTSSTNKKIRLILFCLVVLETFLQALHLFVDPFGYKRKFPRIVYVMIFYAPIYLLLTAFILLTSLW